MSERVSEFLSFRFVSFRLFLLSLSPPLSLLKTKKTNFKRTPPREEAGALAEALREEQSVTPDLFFFARAEGGKVSVSVR